MFPVRALHWEEPRSLLTGQTFTDLWRGEDVLEDQMFRFVLLHVNIFETMTAWIDPEPIPNLTHTHPLSNTVTH